MNYLSNFKICVVIVTYGNRCHLLKQVIEALSLSTIKVDRVVVVDNNSDGLLEEILSSENLKIDIIRCERNTGSAGGYKTGLNKAAAIDCDLVWLLDDDNVPEPQALEAILKQREILGNKQSDVFAAQRINRAKYVSAATTNFNLEIIKNAFFGFTVTNIFKMFQRRLLKAKNEFFHIPSKICYVKRIGYGIYGGLLLHRNWLLKGLFPNDEFYLYMDDVEYTTRLIQNGAQIYLVPESKIRDVDTSWSQKNPKIITPILDFDVDSHKLYYTIRNGCFLSKSRFVDHLFLFYINIFFFTVIMFITGILYGISFRSMLKRIFLMIHAIIDGIRSRLGYRDRIPEI